MPDRLMYKVQICSIMVSWYEDATIVCLQNCIIISCVFVRAKNVRCAMTLQYEMATFLHCIVLA